MTRGRVLVAAPRFHGYADAVAAGFAALGLEARWVEYDAASAIERVRYQVRVEVAGRIGRAEAGRDWWRRRATDRVVDALRLHRPDRLLVVKGDLLAPDVWHEAERQRARPALWLYDDLHNTTWDPGVDAAFRLAEVAATGPVFSYSRADTARLVAAGVGARYLPMAFDERIVPHPVAVDGAVFVGARYPDREDVLVALNRRVPVLAVGRDWSRHPVDRLRSLSWRRPHVPARRDVSRASAAGLMAGAWASLNVHGRHDGINARTFEAAGAGAVGLVDRPDVEHLFEPGREVVVAGDVDAMADAVQRARRDPAWATSLRAAARRRALAEHTYAHRARAVEEAWT